MTSPAALGAALLCLTVQAALAMDPDEAGRQGRRELDALMARQRSETQAATAATPAEAVPKPPSGTGNRRAVRAIDNRVPSICSGC